MLSKIDEREELLQSLQGCSLHIPDLQALLSHWPNYVNPELDRLRLDVDQRLPELVPQADRIRRMKAGDIARFAACWWPFADFESLKTVAYFSIWLFAWDDECDSTEFSTLVSDYDQAKAFRAETIRYMQKCLVAEEDGLDEEPPENPAIASFRLVGEAMAKSCTSGQIQKFLEEFIIFVAMTDVEQKVQMSRKLPSVEEYKECRIGSSCVSACMVLTEYCLAMEIPREVMSDKDMISVWNETNMIISTMNDILSLKKEIMQSQVLSLIPLLYVQQSSLKMAMDVAMNIINESVATFEHSSKQLLERYSSDSELCKNLQRFLHGCRCACTGNLDWSLGTGRYKLGSRSLDGGLTITL